MSCPGCLLSEREYKAALQRIINKAAFDAEQNKKYYIIYRLSDGQPAYMEEEAAKEAKLQPIQFISPMFRASHG